METSFDVAASEQVARGILPALTRHYGLRSVDEFRPLGAGTEGWTWRAATSSGTYFVKLSPPHPLTERRALILEQLGHAGIPVPSLIRTRGGAATFDTDFGAITVWSWVDGLVAEPAFDVSQAEAAAALLARTQRLLAPAPRRGWPEDIRDWRAPDAAKALDRCELLLEHIRSLQHPTARDIEFEDALAARRRQLRLLEQVTAGVPRVTPQLVHFDFTRPNLLFSGSRVAALIDFRGSVATTAWELAKIAFEPALVATDGEWFRTSMSAIRAFVESSHTRAGVVAAPRIAIAYNLTSFYGVFERYFGERRTHASDDIEQYWLNRQATAARLIESLSDITAEITAMNKSSRAARAA